MKKYHFFGDGREPSIRSPKSLTTPEPYIVSSELQEAVNLAIKVERPLLLEGEAGCGKTRLARAIAYEFGLPLFTWHIRSTSKAEEGMYSYDAVLRLHDVQIQNLNSQDPERKLTAGRDPANSGYYLKFGPLGEAFQLREYPAVVLIDEIDKADIDFPNDLLAALDEWEFTIRETGEKVTADPKCKPIVIITSNKEKGSLPKPFLRRCVYHYLGFPNKEMLKQIVEKHFKNDETPTSEDLSAEAVERFLKLRLEGRWHKNPGTSEFLDWLKCLQTFFPSPFDAKELSKTKTVPFPGLLFKLAVDWQSATERL